MRGRRDMSYDERSEPAMPRAWRKRLASWGDTWQGTWREMRATWERPRTQRAARTGALALRALAWRERVSAAVATIRASLARTRATFRLAYFVVPAVAPVRSI